MKKSTIVLLGALGTVIVLIVAFLLFVGSIA
jgi:hypothetical protein